MPRGVHHDLKWVGWGDGECGQGRTGSGECGLICGGGGGGGGGGVWGGGERVAVNARREW